MRIDQSLLYFGIFFSKQQTIIPLTDDEKTQIEDYSNATNTVAMISEEASHLKTLSKPQAVQICGKIRDQLRLLISATETAISQVEEKEIKVKNEILDSSSAYSKTCNEILEKTKLKNEKLQKLMKIENEVWKTMSQYMVQHPDGRMEAFVEFSHKKYKSREEMDIARSKKNDKYNLTISELEKLEKIKNETDLKKRSYGEAKVELSKANALLKTTLQKYNFLSDDINLIREFFDEGILEESQIDDFVEDLKTIEASLPTLEN